MSEAFARLAEHAAQWAGSSWSFAGHLTLILACFALIPIWGLSGAMLGLTTLLTISTGLLAVLIANQQHRTEAELKALLRELVEDLPEVDELRAARRIEEETG